MKWSKYNHLFNRHEHFLLYNSLSNSFVELDNELYKKLQDYVVGENVEVSDPEEEKLLLTIKALVVDDIAELEKIQYYTLLSRFNTSRLSLTINPTLSCNFACPYCFEYEHANRNMSSDVEDKIIKFIQSKPNTKFLNVTWFGGEPLMAFDCIESLTSKFLTLNLNYRAGMISNGYLVTKYNAAKFKDLHINRIQITLDGLEATHNKRRALKNGKPTFARIIDSIDLLITHAPDTAISVRANIDKENQSDFEGLYKFLRDKFGNKIGIKPAFTSDPTGKGTSCLYNQRDKHEFLVNLATKHGIHANDFYPDSTRYECAIRSVGAFVIGPEGELYGCWNDVGNPNRIYGKLGEQDIDEASYVSYKLKADALFDSDCNNCLLFPVCNGGCPYERIKRLEKGENPNDCPLMKNELDDYLWMHYQFKTGNLHQKS